MIFKQRSNIRVIDRTFEPGDIILTGGNAWISRAIRWMTRVGDEEKTIKNHAGIGVTPHTYVEALWTTERNTYDYLLNLKDTNIEIWRNNNLTMQEKEKIRLKAIEYVGTVYGVSKIILHAFDGLLSKLLGHDIYLFRKIGFMKRYPICSWVVAYAYDEIGYKFNNQYPKYVSPDDIHDHLLSDPDWKLVYTTHTEYYTDYKSL